MGFKTAGEEGGARGGGTLVRIEKEARGRGMGSEREARGRGGTLVRRSNSRTTVASAPPLDSSSSTRRCRSGSASSSGLYNVYLVSARGMWVRFCG